ncbi:conserved Plasmodium protein, unknown function [Plasmodium chabaudi chabaudi]|uniref:Uncharacterized protein n=1 Tax=Plasmodium chabaudi chabaudi TaxID=31271 RepID=A0A4V0K419_PLACU|nr:conserved Plasmodium protein, unknown function [Plasmodium chabaudi chabaudi]VTZ67243.1 conserved Plasmodium protein, unknown function [Plasmodium chabaudi chabaudi]|eukprot:XP_016653303.1 conserved Plasmodium protein, unknown function [Plasmodium chabaudi chabaudi]
MDLKCETENETPTHSQVTQKENITEDIQSECSDNKPQNISENLENSKESSNVDNTPDLENKHNILENSDNTKSNSIQQSNEEPQINKNDEELTNSEIEKNDNFEDDSFFNNFSDFQKAEEKNEQKKSTPIDIYNEMKNYENDFLNTFEKLYKTNIENISFMEKEKENETECDIDFTSIDSISTFLNDEHIHNFNPIPLENYISQNINYFVQEQMRLNKKIKLNKSHFNNQNYYNTFPSNPKQKIFKEYKKTIWK